MNDRRCWIARAIFSFVVLVSLSAARADAAVLDPLDPGANGQTWLQNFLTLSEDLLSTPNVTRRLQSGNKWLLVTPWFRTSDRCQESDLHGYDGFPTPSFSHYLVNGDEFSEVFGIIATGSNRQRMAEAHNTVEALRIGAGHAGTGLPCWLAQVHDGVLSCYRNDTASDITGRLGLFYLVAAQNPAFSPAERATYRNSAAALGRLHLDAEYANFNPAVEVCPQLAPSGRHLCDWIGGGANTATRSAFDSADSHMWIGYFQDVARFLIALAESESVRDPTLASRARAVADEVVEEWLGASRFQGSAATFGDLEFKWNAHTAPIAPLTVTAWDYDDAPRALWMGDVLRAISLHTRGAALTGAYVGLSDWVQLLLAGNTQQATCSVIKYEPNGQPLEPCNAGFYENGLGAGLLTHHSTGLLGTKIATALGEYHWAEKRWGGDPAACFGIYRPVRPMKALASAIGLDESTYAIRVQPQTTPADFDGDRVSDWIAYRSGAWAYFGPESGPGAPPSVWTGGGSGCIPAPADYDGDGTIDLALKCGGVWQFYDPNGSYIKGIWVGDVAGDLPVPADYDGDGDADVVVYRAGTWLSYDYATGAYTGGVWTGPGPNTVPLPLDYDGDGRADFSVLQDGAWHFYDHDGSYRKGIWIGDMPGDVPVPGNYRGLGRDDVVIFRGGAWLFFSFATGLYDGGVWTGVQPYAGQPLQPAPLDLDGDGMLELTVYTGGPWHFFNDDGSYGFGVWTGGIEGAQPISRRQLP